MCRYPWGPEEEAESPETGARGTCEPPEMDAWNQPHPLEEQQQVILITEPSL